MGSGACQLDKEEGEKSKYCRLDESHEKLKEQYGDRNEIRNKKDENRDHSLSGENITEEPEGEGNETGCLREQINNADEKSHRRLNANKLER